MCQTGRQYHKRESQHVTANPSTSPRFLAPRCGWCFGMWQSWVPLGRARSYGCIVRGLKKDETGLFSTLDLEAEYRAVKFQQDILPPVSPAMYLADKYAHQNIFPAALRLSRRQLRRSAANFRFPAPLRILAKHSSARSSAEEFYTT